MGNFAAERARILSICLEKMVDGEWSLTQAVAQYPAWKQEIWELAPVVRMLRVTGEGEAPTDFMRVAQARRERQRARLDWIEATGVAPPPAPQAPRGGSQPWAGWGLALTVLALLLLLVAGAGVVQAADAARPGDLLYRLDRALEARALARLSDPTMITLQRLADAEERLEELAALDAGAGGEVQVQLALREYGLIVGTLVEESARAGAARPPALTAVVDEALATQALTLEAVLAAQHGGAGPAPGRCAPGAGVATIAGLYGADEATLDAWRCAGFNLGEIVVALETNRRLAVPVDTLLASKRTSPGWGQVWQGMRPQPGAEPTGFGQQNEPPGQQNEPPGQQNEPPGQQNEPPGQQNEPPGQQNEPPGQQNEPPGQQNDPPGQQNDPPGQQHDPPGQQNEPPGQQNEPPGQQNEPPGQQNEPPGQQNEPPGQQNEPPGQQNEPPGQQNRPPGR